MLNFSFHKKYIEIMGNKNNKPNRGSQMSSKMAPTKAK